MTWIEVKVGGLVLENLKEIAVGRHKTMSDLIAAIDMAVTFGVFCSHTAEAAPALAKNTPMVSAVVSTGPAIGSGE